MTERRASDVFVECLENKGVRRVFEIPGEETLDLNHALHESSIKFVVVRHERGGASMADVTGRLTATAAWGRRLEAAQALRRGLRHLLR